MSYEYHGIHQLREPLDLIDQAHIIREILFNP